ncbi:MAG: DNA polymerase I [Parachlamydiaceae bacterium]|nr:DNA polymerase I [Parachlamydiaceae bacterium]
MKKIYVIDASGYLYSCYFAIRNMTNSKGESTNALYGFIRSILKLIKDFQPDHIVSVFDGPRNGMKRKALYPEYKAHRSEAPQDLYYQIKWAEEFCHLIGIPVLNIPEVEADDTMGSLSRWAESQQAEAYLCTSDKDMCQLVNAHIHLLNTRKDNLIIGAIQVEEIHGVPPEQMIDYLAMTGDASDNIPGLPGIGPKTAVALLKQFGSLDNLLAAPEKISSEKRRASIIENADKAILSRQLVKIDQYVDIPQETNYYKLKSPNDAELKAFYSQMSFHTLLKEVSLTSQITFTSQTRNFTQGTFDFDGVDTKPIDAPPANLGPVVLNYTLVDDEKSLETLVAFLKLQKEICFDTMTTNVQPIKAELIGIGLGIAPENAWYIPTNGSLTLKHIIDSLKPLFEDPKIGFYGHNVKYDLHVLANYGITVASICFDTLVASYLLNSHNRQHSLDHISLQYFGKVKISISELLGKGKSAINLQDVPLNSISEYCCEDVDYASRLKVVLEKEIKERRLDSLLHELELPLLKILAKMERHGIYLDQPCLKLQATAIQQALQGLEQEIYKQAGDTFNINSPQQMSRILQEKLHITLPKKTATGFSTNADILEALKDDYPICHEILEYRTLEKLRSTYVENLPKEVNLETGRIHCTFNQSVAATGRLSCQDPNLQNIPVRSEVGRQIREAFRPQKEGWSYLAADYSQVELRLLAHLSEDPTLLQAFNNNEDIHTSTAATIFNVPLMEVTKEQRHKAKAVNFGLVYGQQAFGLAKELHIEVKEAAAIIETYFKRYYKVKEFLESSKEQARNTGKAVTFTGRERLIPEITSKNGQLRQLAERLAVNTPIQGTQADLIKLAMLSIDKKLSNADLKGYMILQIHDELIFEIPDNEAEAFIPLVRETMEEVLKLKIPLIVDITIGKNWKEC